MIIITTDNNNGNNNNNNNSDKSNNTYYCNYLQSTSACEVVTYDRESSSKLRSPTFMRHQNSNR